MNKRKKTQPQQPYYVQHCEFVSRFFFRFPKQKLLLHKKTLWHLFIDGLQLPQG